MKLLLTNDDGIDAPGLQALAAAAAHLGEVVVAAPHRAYSGCGHQATTQELLHVEQWRPGWTKVEGSPADCVRLGLLELAPDADYVIAGVNEGANLGVDVYMSGTVAAAREASFLGKPALAISQYRNGKTSSNWERSANYAKLVIDTYLSRPLPSGRYWNVNLPDSTKADPDMVECGLESCPLAVAYEKVNGAFRYAASYQERKITPGSDVDHCFNGRIAITELGDPIAGS